MSSISDSDEPVIRVGLPKGHIQENVLELLRDANIEIDRHHRNYRPSFSMTGFEAKILKPQSVAKMVAAGSRDVGFTGADWVEELEADVVEVLDTELDPVRLVAAAPADMVQDGDGLPENLVVATEYERLTERWLANTGRSGTVIQSYGATEVFPPEDADVIVDVSQTGRTLAANDLVVVDELITSSTRLYANPDAWNDPVKRDEIDRFALLLQSVLDGRRRVMLEVNVDANQLEDVIEAVPAMRKPTVAPLHNEDGYAVKAAVPKDDVTSLVPDIKRAGGTDIVVTDLAQIVV